MKKTALILALTAATSYAITTYEVGTYIADINSGACAAFQDDPTADTDCSNSCSATGSYIKNAFDTSTYN